MGRPVQHLYFQLVLAFADQQHIAGAVVFTQEGVPQQRFFDKDPADPGLQFQ